ncbi:MAG: phosphoribosylaminoimidazolesuccinocarboxamide synthase [Gammaproteobacteria bacterium]|nr:MAG: phosphoribosylaminoimidazolesuccinocarboxamide synthase [Gammaproteobacteria bacterium]
MSAVPDTLYQSELSSLELIGRGKVRDLYAIDDDHLMIVTTDRLSAFDVILPTAIPGKGAVLTTVSLFWFERMRDVIPNHLATLSLSDVLSNREEREQVHGRAMIVRRLRPLPIEAVVRGYLVGSGWKDYQRDGSVCGIPLPTGLQLAEKLPTPLYTPSTKAEAGDHDENIDYQKTVELIGPKLAEKVRDVSLQIYGKARDYAAGRGIIIADTKFEFGLDNKGQMILIDEALTPDSSRFWPLDGYRTGISPPSFDKQFVRDYLETLDWNKQPPGPELPDDVARKTAEKYLEAQRRLIGAI